ncbi:MAG: Ig-like domain-containing protein, partial [Bacteroidales bacterium]|nr:Ig-like domain-containing protein [Bacteroidales bacterium]
GNFFYDVSKYDSLSFKFTFDPADAGKQIAIRIAWDKKGVTLYELTYPADGSTSMIHNISLDGKSHLDGMNFYNGKSHWSFTYTGTAATQAMSIDYVALKTVIPTAVSIEAVDPVLAQGLPLGLTTQLNAVFAPVKATYNDVVWESLNTELATVDATGLVTANTTQAGVASIKVSSVTYPELTATFDVTIVDALTPVSGVELDLSSIQLKVLTSKTLAATVLPSTATNRNIVWSSSDESIATVDQAGLITPVSGGTVDIVVETEDGSFKDTCVVTVVGPLAIPAAYTSLYTLNFNDAGTSKLLSANLTDLGANLPAVISSVGGSLLGAPWNWNAADKYVDLSAYTELQVACAFKTEDIGKKLEFRYAFSTLTGSIITNRVVEITSEAMLLTVDLDADTADVDGLKRVGAVKFRNNVSGDISFVVDYIAVKAAPIAVSSVALTDTAVVMALGENYTLEYNVLPVDAADKTVVWSSSNEAAATVEDGVLTAVSPGTTLVKVFAATDNSLVDSCLVTVTNIPSGSVNLYSLQYQSDVHQQVDMSGTVDAGAEKLLVGPGQGWGDGNFFYDVSKYDSLSFKFTFDPADAGKQIAIRIAWDKKGVTLYELTYPTDGSTSMIHNISLEGKSHLDGMNFYNGKSHWSFSYTGTAATQAMTIDYVALKTVIPTGVSIEAADPVLAQALPLGLTTQLNAVFAPVKATYNDVVWESLNTDLATVDATGLVTANATQAGVASIKVSSVTYPALADTFEVTIVDALTPVSGVELDLSAIQLKVLTSKTLVATVLPSTATNRNIVWSSSDESIATVDQAGLITPVSGGTVDIVVETEDGSFKDTCVVTVAGHLPIPAGYVSLYTLNYSDAGTSKLLSANLTDLGANLPAVFSSDVTGLLGYAWNWNAADKYVDLTAYSELQVACAFKTEDIGKKFDFRYAFSTLTGSIITNRVVEITSEEMLLTVDLDADTADVDGLKRLGAVKFRNNVDGAISFVVDYIAVKVAPIVVKSVALTDTAVVLAPGASQTLEYSVLPANAEDLTVTWSTGNEAVATVEDGVVTAVGLGSTYVKVTSVADANLSDSCLITVSYVPADYVDLYSLQYNSASFTQTVQTGLVTAATERLLVGPANGWGSGDHYYDIANYDSLIIKLNFDASDAGKQVALRIAYDKMGVTLYEITYPTDGSTSLLYKVDISAKNQLDGMNFYNGAPHWSFTYTGTPAAQAVTVEYVALKLEDPNSVPSVTIDTDADAIVNVYSMTGVLVRRAVKFSEATEGLDKGLYIVGKKKVLVTR